LNPVVAKFKRAHSIEKTDRRILTDQPNFCFVGNIKAAALEGSNIPLLFTGKKHSSRDCRKQKLQDRDIAMI